MLQSLPDWITSWSLIIFNGGNLLVAVVVTIGGLIRAFLAKRAYEKYVPECNQDVVSLQFPHRVLSSPCFRVIREGGEGTARVVVDATAAATDGSAVVNAAVGQGAVAGAQAVASGAQSAADATQGTVISAAQTTRTAAAAAGAGAAAASVAAVAATTAAGQAAADRAAATGERTVELANRAGQAAPGAVEAARAGNSVVNDRLGDAAANVAAQAEHAADQTAAHGAAATAAITQAAAPAAAAVQQHPAGAAVASATQPIAAAGAATAAAAASGAAVAAEATRNAAAATAEATRDAGSAVADVAQDAHAEALAANQAMAAAAPAAATAAAQAVEQVRDGNQAATATVASAAARAAPLTRTGGAASSAVAIQGAQSAGTTMADATETVGDTLAEHGRAHQAAGAAAVVGLAAATGAGVGARQPKPEPEPEPEPEPVPEPVPTSPPQRGPAIAAVVGGGYRVQPWAASRPPLHGPTVSGFAWWDGPLLLGGGINAAVALPQRFALGAIDVRAWGVDVVALTSLGGFVARRVSVHTELGGGLTVLRVVSRSDAATAQVPAPRTLALPTLVAQLGPSIWLGKPGRRAVLSIRVGAQAEVVDLRFVADGGLLAFNPWRIRPQIELSAAFGWARRRP